MNLKKLSYIILVIVLSVSLFLGFIVDTFNVDVGYLNNVLKKVSSPFVLAVGIVFAMSMGEVYSKFNNLMSKKMLQCSVVALGFGMNIEKSLGLWLGRHVADSCQRVCHIESWVGHWLENSWCKLRNELFAEFRHRDMWRLCHRCGRFCAKCEIRESLCFAGSGVCA